MKSVTTEGARATGPCLQEGPRVCLLGSRQMPLLASKRQEPGGAGMEAGATSSKKEPDARSVVSLSREVLEYRVMSVYTQGFQYGKRVPGELLIEKRKYNEKLNKNNKKYRK